LETSPSWQEYLVDLSPAAGAPTVQIRFTFNTNDELYNGFRGWLIDTLTVDTPYDAPAPSVSGVTVCNGSSDAPVTTINGAGFIEGSTAIVDGSPVSDGTNVLSSGRIEITALAAGSHSVAVQAPNGATSNTVQVTAGNCSASPPAITANSAAAQNSTTATLDGMVNPNGQSTVAHWEYGIDPSLRENPNTPLYDQRTADQPLGSGTTPVPVIANLTGLVPNALYHARLVATSSLGTTTGPDIKFRTPADPAPPPPVLGKSEDLTPLTGVVFVKLPAGHGASDHSAQANLAKGNGFVPLTEARQVPLGSQIDSRRGTLRLLTARPAKHKTQSGVFGGALFKATQTKSGVLKGLTTLSLLENLFAGAPSFKGCPARLGKALDATAAKARPKVLQTLHARDNHGSFRTKGRYSAGTVRGTVWDTSDQCNGTLTTVQRGVVDVLDFHRHKTIVVHAGHSYLAKP
jgi:hypothetical protein